MIEIVHLESSRLLLKTGSITRLRVINKMDTVSREQRHGERSGVRRRVTSERKFPQRRRRVLRMYCDAPALAHGRECSAMSWQNKIANKVQVLKGKAKQTAGRISHDRGLEAEGRADQSKGDLKQAGEKLKDAGRRLFGS